MTGGTTLVLLLGSVTATPLLHLRGSTQTERLHLRRDACTPAELIYDLRGGQLFDEDDFDDGEDGVDDSESESGADGSGIVQRKLTRQEITEKLNAIPTFCIMNDEGGVVGMRSKGDSTTSCLWYTDAAEAQAFLKIASDANPDAGLRLGCHGLGAVFSRCGGWTGNPLDEPEPAATAPGGETIHLKVMGSHKLVEEVAPRLRDLLTSQGLDAGTWQLPVFMCTELSTRTIIPVFLHPHDLAATWVAAGREEAAIPEDLKVMDVRSLVNQMATEDNAWQLMQFVPSNEAVDLANTLQSRSGGAPPAD